MTDDELEGAKLFLENVLNMHAVVIAESSRAFGRNSQQTSAIKEALKLKEPLSIAYVLKEDLRTSNALSAELFLSDWCRRARASGIKVLNTMAKTLEGYLTGILNWYSYKISTMKRQAYGYRDQEYHQLKLSALHETKFRIIA